MSSTRCEALVKHCEDCPFLQYVSPIDDQSRSGGGSYCGAPVDPSKTPIETPCAPPDDCPLRVEPITVSLHVGAR